MSHRLKRMLLSGIPSASGTLGDTGVERAREVILIDIEHGPLTSKLAQHENTHMHLFTR